MNAHLRPPLGGDFVIMIKAKKRTITTVIGNADVTSEDFHTAFRGSESSLNSRPLIYQSADIRNDKPLNSNFFFE